ncbi:hypothetical protein MTO96_013315 [Rhipicephalus appendiculatus]
MVNRRPLTLPGIAERKRPVPSGLLHPHARALLGGTRPDPGPQFAALPGKAISRVYTRRLPVGRYRRRPKLVVVVQGDATGRAPKLGCIAECPVLSL